MPDDELDELYAAEPNRFTALRSTLSAAAKRRGDTAVAKQISAARKPTTAAWVVNRLTLQHKESKQRLAELGDRLRAAHSTMDGDLIRRLSMEQHRLVNELTRAAFAGAGLTNPSATVRDDVSSTLQAAVADPDVTARLGRLAKAERWSGFGVLGEAAPEPARKTSGTAHRQLEKLQQAWAAAKQAKTDADRELTAREEELSAARRRLRESERDVKSAEKAYDTAKQASHDAAELVKKARSRLSRQA
ncbi:hypothetical protein A5707_13550 [Mycobacterium kyorinense]|uniref:Uncharacterized protein n=1 Tax=Mycobacterium kyorinense TaxID=487514 RepID=A0A1A2ZPV9_9MYCO|nr:hypothetical protein [Mycobacterium kyorinense]OBI51728.1 hypothetical protein A5707_13550 [Mycobacterium kyorinense]